jgi:DNA-binding PadR family transcriptional regulator
MGASEFRCPQSACAYAHDVPTCQTLVLKSLLSSGCVAVAARRRSLLFRSVVGTGLKAWKPLSVFPALIPAQFINLYLTQVFESVIIEFNIIVLNNIEINITAMASGATTQFWRRWAELQGALNLEELERDLEAATTWRRIFGEFFGTAPESHWLFGGRRYRMWFSGAWGAPGQFNPFVGAAMSKGSGLLALYVLHLLAQAPRYGNDIMRQIEERTGGRWAANPGAIYPLLDSMEESGLLTGVWEDERKRTRRVYSLTLAGRDELQRIKDVIRPLLREAIEVLSDLYAETGQHDVETASSQQAS